MKGLNNPDLDAAVGEDLAQQLRDELELVQGRRMSSTKICSWPGKSPLSSSEPR